jgi:predicted dipeptidase
MPHQEEIESSLKNQHEKMKAAVCDLVRIPSVLDESAQGTPFGEPIDRALHTALQIAAELGFRTRYGDGGYYGIAETGEGEEMLGILGHLDVVPPGNRDDWSHDPFDPVEKDGMLFGRGTQDDKGPMMAALFAVNALMEAGVRFDKRVRFIFGTDEETLWRCIKRYKSIEEHPNIGFSPDSRFPLTYAEKGLLQLHLEGRNESGLSMSGGSAFNAVPDSVQYSGERQDEVAAKLAELGFDSTRTPGGITVLGKAAHGMVPEEGTNAISRLCIALHAVGIESKAIRFIAQEIGEDPYATRIFGACIDEPSGQLKMNVGKIELGEVERLSVDIRIPVTVAKEGIVSMLSEAAAGYGLEYKEFDWLAPIYVPLDHPLVETLMKVYREASGDLVSQPVSSGGATYARAFDNCVAYGALSFGELLTEHQPNERAVLGNLYKAMEIYAHAVYELAGAH